MYEEDVSSASTAASISPLSPVFGSDSSKKLEFHGAASAPSQREGVNEEEDEEPYDDDDDEAMDLHHAALLTRPTSHSFDEYDVDGGLFVDQDDSLLQQRTSSTSLVSQHKRLPSTIYEDDHHAGPNTHHNNDSNSPMRPLMRSNRTSHGSSLALAALDASDTPGMPRIASCPSTQEYLPPDENNNSHPLLASPGGLRRTSRSTSSLPGASFNPTSSSSSFSSQTRQQHYYPYFTSTRLWHALSQRFLPHHTQTPLHASTWLGFWALLHITCANYVLTPLRDAIALRVGLEVLPLLTLASTAMAVGSSVPIGWLFEAPDPARRKWWKKMGLTRGQTQGTSLALFYRCFAWFLLVYGVLFCVLEWMSGNDDAASERSLSQSACWVSWQNVISGLYIVFYLVVHLMKLHSLSLVWGVTTEAMEYEEVARRKMGGDSTKTRLQELALVGFGGTLGGVLGRYVIGNLMKMLISLVIVVVVLISRIHLVLDSSQWTGVFHGAYFETTRTTTGCRHFARTVRRTLH